MNDTHFNINPMLLQNISQSPYFIKCCNNLKDWNTLVDEIYYEVSSLEPWSNGKILLYCYVHNCHLKRHLERLVFNICMYT